MVTFLILAVFFENLLFVALPTKWARPCSWIAAAMTALLGAKAEIATNEDNIHVTSLTCLGAVVGCMIATLPILFGELRAKVLTHAVSSDRRLAYNLCLLVVEIPICWGWPYAIVFALLVTGCLWI